MSTLPMFKLLPLTSTQVLWFFSWTNPQDLCLFLRDHMTIFCLHNTDTISFPIFTSRFLRYNKQKSTGAQSPCHRSGGRHDCLVLCVGGGGGEHYARRVDLSVLAFSLSLHLHPYVYSLYLSLYLFIINKKKTLMTLYHYKVDTVELFE